jgi:uridylate kinase
VHSRVILKVSGEALAGEAGEPLSFVSAERLAAEIEGALQAGAEIGVVIGGGNILRGVAAERRGLDRVASDHMGMLATVVNGLALRAALEARGVRASVMSAIACGAAAPGYDQKLADAHLAEGRVVIFTGGTGNPFFSTDTAAALRAAELGADALLKATQVDGVYDADPVESPNAKRYSEITYEEMIVSRLAVMDATAVSLAREQRIPILVFELAVPGNIARAVAGEPIGTSVKGV